ncbi:hypothetical protein ILYODFUR_033630 [Ilyodon furcidens]|uniref:Uncharacterized protein n=1 Tax=Ilyodon furcidens TaxID=33524 RepID=A0ABV0VA55_9TELE
MKRMLRVLHNVLHFMKHPYLHIDLQRFQRSPKNRASLLYWLVELFQVPGSDAATPADDSRRYSTIHNKPVKDMKNLVANTEGPKLPQEVQSALSILVYSFTVASPVQSIVQVNTEILHSSATFTFSPMMEMMFDIFPFLLKSIIISFICSLSVYNLLSII